MPSEPGARPRVAVSLTQCWHGVPGGTATSVLQMLDALVARGDVDLVGVGARGAPHPNATPPDAVPLRRFPLPVGVLYDSWNLTGRPSLDSLVGRDVGGVDVIHMTVPMGPPRSATPTVVTVHDVFPLSRPDWFTRRGARLMGRSLRRIRDRADLVLVPSAVVARDCVEHGFDPDRLRVVPWGSTPVDVEVRSVAEVRRRFGLDGPYVLFVGTLEPRKGLAVLADAMARLARPGLALVIAGPAGWGPRADGDLGGVPGPVVRVGYVGRAQLDALRSGAAVCCVPSFAEGFGLPALEALAAGAPLVTSAGTASAEVAGDAAVLVPPGRPDLLASALGRVVDDDDLGRRLRAEGPLRAATFRWEDTATAVAEAYRSVLT